MIDLETNVCLFLFSCPALATWEDRRLSINHEGGFVIKTTAEHHPNTHKRCILWLPHVLISPDSPLLLGVSFLSWVYIKHPASSYAVPTKPSQSLPTQPLALSSRKNAVGSLPRVADNLMELLLSLEHITSFILQDSLIVN